MIDYKHMRPKPEHLPREPDPIARAELRGLFVGLIYGAVIGIVILAPLWSQLLDAPR